MVGGLILAVAVCATGWWRTARRARTWAREAFTQAAAHDQTQADLAEACSVVDLQARLLEAHHDPSNN